ncbi:MAG: lysophospholipid acyltransferase family protein [Bacteroidota bacterium]
MRLFEAIFLKLYMVWVLLVFSVFMIIFLPLIVVPIVLGQRYGRITYFGLWLWSWVFSMLTFIRYEITGTENITQGQSYIYASNHTSFLDLPGLRLAIPTEFRPLAKKELLKIPVFGLIAKVTTVVVDRSSNESRKKSINTLKKHIESGISLLIFPEGTQNRTKYPLQPFYDGAFRLAKETATPIMPMVVINAGKLMPPSSVRLRPGKIKVIFGSPILVDFNSDITQLRQDTYNYMLKIIDQNS